MARRNYFDVSRVLVGGSSLNADEVILLKQRILAVCVAAGLLAAGCAHQQPVMMAPPMQNAPMQMQQANGPVYQWQQVPVGQQVPVVRAVFDQNGYQIYDQAGDTILVPFANQNMYVMRFGQSNNGAEYFVNDGNSPTLYLPPGGALQNASAQGALWYPFPQNYAYNGPVYMGLAPSWSAFTSMGWYPGMAYYGGYWGYHPWGLGAAFVPMIGLHFLIGGHPYYGFSSYQNYYVAHPYNRVNIYHSAGRSLGGFGTGSYHGGGFGSANRTGSFGSGSFSTRNTGSFGGGSFGTRNTGSFGSGASGFGASNRTSSGSFGSRPSGFGGGSFGGSGGFGSSRPFGSSTTSFGGGARSFGGSFGGGSHSFGGGFGGGGFGGGSFRRRH